MQKPEDYRENPIWKTDFSNPISVILENMRGKIVKLRGTLTDIKFGYPDMYDRIEYIEGFLTTGLISIDHSAKEMAKIEIKRDDHIYGESISFRPRGLGSDNCPGCFVCGGKGGLMNNISGFVASEEEGKNIISWFTRGAYLDFRPHEPEWIQVKIGACKNHIGNLKELIRLSSVHCILRKAIIETAISYPTN